MGENKNKLSGGKKVIIGALIFFLPLLLFIVIIITPVIILNDDIDMSGLGVGGLNYSYIDSTSDFWWPIGSESTTKNNNITYAKDNPVKTEIIYRYGEKNDSGLNKGIDIIAIENKDGEVNVIAVKDGTVTYPSEDDKTNCPSNKKSDDDCGDGYGNYVMIEHNDGTVTLYANLAKDSITVKKGDKVKQGQVIGKMGSSGSCEQVQLHFEVITNGTAVNPENYVDKNNSRPSGKYNINFGEGYGTAEENKKAICQSLLAAGYSKEAVAGMMVNLAAEGSFLTNNMEDCYELNKCCYSGTYGFCTKSSSDPLRKYANDTAYTSAVDNGSYKKDNFVKDRVGYGLVQWTWDNRKKGLYEAAKSNNKSIADLGVQFNYFMDELKSPSYMKTIAAITDETLSAYQVAVVFCTNYEGPRGSCYTRASANSKQYSDYVKNGCQ